MIWEQEPNVWGDIFCTPWGNTNQQALQDNRGWEQELRQLLLFQLLEFVDLPSWALPLTRFSIHIPVSVSCSIGILETKFLVRPEQVSTSRSLSSDQGARLATRRLWGLRHRSCTEAGETPSYEPATPADILNFTVYKDTQGSWYNTLWSSGVGPEILHLWQASRWCQCCWSMDHTFIH